MINAKDLSPEAQFAFACFLKAEINRHAADIGNALHDLDALRQIGVDVKAARDIGFVTTEDAEYDMEKSMEIDRLKAELLRYREAYTTRLNRMRLGPSPFSDTVTSKIGEIEIFIYILDELYRIASGYGVDDDESIR